MGDLPSGFHQLFFQALNLHVKKVYPLVYASSVNGFNFLTPGGFQSENTEVQKMYLA